MDLSELRAFVEVADAGSFVAAAARLGCPRATLRRRVEALEARVGAPLLVRSPAGARLSPAGARLRARVGTLLDDADALLRGLGEDRAEPYGPVSVSLPVGGPPVQLMALLAALRHRFPRVQLHLRMAADPLRESLSGVDIVVHIGDVGPGPRWITRTLVRAREHALASPAYLRRRGVPSSIAALRDHDLLGWAAPHRPPDAWPLREGGSIQVPLVFSVPDAHLLRQMAARGFGIALLPEAGVRDADLPPELLEPVLPDRIGGPLAVSVSVPEALAEVPRVRGLFDAIVGGAATMLRPMVES